MIYRIYFFLVFPSLFFTKNVFCASVSVASHEVPKKSLDLILPTLDRFRLPSTFPRQYLAYYQACQALLEKQFSAVSEQVISEMPLNEHGQTLLHTMVSERMFTQIEHLLKAGIDINHKDASGRTALHFACKYGDEETAALLIQCGAQLSIQDEDGSTPLHLALQNNHKKLAQLLCSSYDVDRKLFFRSSQYAFFETVFNSQLAQFNKEVTNLKSLLSQCKKKTHLISNQKLIKPLTTRIAYVESEKKRITEQKKRIFQSFEHSHSCQTFVKVLLTEQNASYINKADIFFVRNRFGQTILHETAKTGDSKCAAFIIDKTDNAGVKDCCGRLPLHWAACSGSAATVKLLAVKDTLDCTDDAGRTALCYAARNGRADCVATLIELGANIDIVDNSGFTALELAKKAKCSKCVSHLESAMSRRKVREVFPSYLVFFGHSLAKSLLSNALPDDYDSSIEYFSFDLAPNHVKDIENEDKVYINNPLSLASFYKIAPLFSLESYNILSKSSAGRSCLMRSVRVKIPLILTDSIATYSSRGKGKSASICNLIDSSFRGRPETYDFSKFDEPAQESSITKSKKNVDDNTEAQDKANDLLFQAIDTTNLGLAEEAYKKGAVLTSKNAFGYTPLHVAALKGDNSSLLWLLEHKVDANIRGPQGATALHIVAFQGHEASARLLIKYGAQKNIADDKGITPTDAAHEAKESELEMLLNENSTIEFDECNN